MTRPPYSTFPILTNNRIILREVHGHDLEALVEISFYDGTAARNSAEAQIMNEKIQGDYLKHSSLHWVIASTSTGEILGTCGFYRGFEEDTGEIGYVLKKVSQGKDYMSEAVSLMLTFGWEELGLKTIKGVTSQNNKSSIKVLTRAGFVLREIKDDELILIISRPEDL